MGAVEEIDEKLLDTQKAKEYIFKTEYSKEYLMKSFIKVMKALSDPSRVRIIKMLQRKTMCVCEMQAALEVAQPTVSNHLKVLEEAGLVTFYKEKL